MIWLTDGPKLDRIFHARRHLHHGRTTWRSLSWSRQIDIRARYSRFVCTLYISANRYGKKGTCAHENCRKPEVECAKTTPGEEDMNYQRPLSMITQHATNTIKQYRQSLVPKRRFCYLCQSGSLFKFGIGTNHRIRVPTTSTKLNSTNKRALSPNMSPPPRTEKRGEREVEDNISNDETKAKLMEWMKRRIGESDEESVGIR